MLKLLHVDDHPAIRKAAEDALAAEFKGLECVGVDSYAQGLQALSEHRFDAVLLDLMINEQFELHQIKRFTAQAKTIVWSMRFNYGIIRTALDHGARAVIGKHEPLETLVHAVATVADAQKFFLSAEGQAILAEGGLRTGYLPPGYYDLHQLSGREIQVLRLAGQGYCIQD
ncbi:MAG: response regulator transcription factor, partial [Wenzhouxiangella sp.]